MGINNVIILLSLLALFGLYSCAEDVESEGGSEVYLENNSVERVNPNESRKIIVEKKTDSSSINRIKEKKIKVDSKKPKPVEEKVVTKEKELPKTIVNEKTTVKEQKKVNSDIEHISSNSQKEEKNDVVINEEIHLSAELDLSVDRNQQYNPDNANALLDLEKGSKITIVPIFSEKDLAMYYVQFVESAKKLNKSELASYINQECEVFVVFHLGLYKYSVFKSENEDTAKAALKIFDSNCGDNESMVTTYKSDW